MAACASSSFGIDCQCQIDSHGYRFTANDRIEIGNFWKSIAAGYRFNIDYFTGISFTHHMEILHKTKNVDERLFYIQQSVLNHWNKYELREWLKQDLYHHQGTMANNFATTISDDKQYLRAVRMFKDEYFLDFINTEELDLTDLQDMDERVLENEIISHIRNFIQCLGSGFCFIGNLKLTARSFLQIYCFSNEI